jgi:hypothetical protein
MPRTNDNSDEMNTRPKNRRALSAFHIVGSALLAVALTVMVNLLTLRLGLSHESQLAADHPISGRTRTILTHAQGPLKAICFFDHNHPLFRPVGRLLRGFKVVAESSGTEMEVSYVDPRRDLAAAAALTAASVPPNALVFEGKGRRIVVPAMDLATTNVTGAIVFRGEAVSAAAIARLGRAGSSVVYWIKGHGEGDPADYDTQIGFSEIAREIRHEGFDLRVLEMWSSHGVPADADALIIAGPHRALAPEELAWVETYLTRGGRLLYLVNPGTASGLEGALDRWGVRVSPWTAVSHETLSGHDTLIKRYGDHPITRSLTNSSTLFLGSRCLYPVNDTNAVAVADRPHYTALAFTGPDGWGAGAAETLPRSFDPHEDQPGPVSVAVAVERGGQQVGLDIAMHPTRLVVVGESAFVANSMLTTRSCANRDFFINALNWLTDIDSGTGVSDGGDAALWIGLDRRSWLVFTLLAAGAAPLVVALIGALVMMRRRARM